MALALEGVPAQHVLDLGTGSGAILLTLLAEWPAARGLGIDASPAALAVAGANAAALGLAALIGLVQVPRATHHLADVIAGAAVGIAAEAVVHHALQALPADRVRAGRRALIRRRGASGNDA